MTWSSLEQQLASLRAQNLERCLSDWLPDPQPGYIRNRGKRLLDLVSNDYLGLARQTWTADSAHDLLRGTPEEQVVLDALTRPGAGAARLISGNHPVFEALERELADLKGREAALIFGSGWTANTGVLPALVGRGDAVFSDAYNHASIIDGIRLSRADVHIYPHRDLRALEGQLAASQARIKLIVTDALFSMDGTLAPVEELVELKRRYGAWLMLDEAHTGGVYGPEGTGLAGDLGAHRDVDVLMGTLSKAYGSVGAYIAGDELLIQYLLNKARSFIFTTGLPPMNVAISLLNVRTSRQLDGARATLHGNARRFRGALRGAGFNLAGSESHIVPAILGTEAKALAAANLLRGKGFGAVAIRPPTVPPHSARLRFALGAQHQWPDLARCAGALRFSQE